MLTPEQRRQVVEWAIAAVEGACGPVAGDGVSVLDPEPYLRCAGDSLRRADGLIRFEAACTDAGVVHLLTQQRRPSPVPPGSPPSLDGQVPCLEPCGALR